MPLDLNAYRREAEAFLSALDREYYRHYAGLKDDYDIEPLYERHAGLFTRESVAELRGAGSKLLLEFAVHGLIGQETKAAEADLAHLEATIELELDGGPLPFREAPIVQANERDPERRDAIESARNAVTKERLDPILRELLERSHAVAAELGWHSMLDMCEELSGIDLRALGRAVEQVLSSTEDTYRRLIEPQLAEHLGIALEGTRRADLPALFRAPSLDTHFPAERLMPALAETLTGLGIDLRGQPGVTVDTEQRPTKSPRAFCAPVRVPDEIYLVIARIGGRDDYAALFHEAGHAEHYAHVDPELPVEQRHLGDNSVTEAFAFLFEHLLADREWLRRRLDTNGAGQSIESHAHAVELLYLRRYCAKLGYELELHDAPSSLEPLAGSYARRMSAAVGIDWPQAGWLADVDPFFYSARYLRAWALEAHLRRGLTKRFGPAWFERREAGDLLRSLWRHGQRLDADQLLQELTGARLDFSALLAELARPAASPASTRSR